MVNVDIYIIFENLECIGINYNENNKCKHTLYFPYFNKNSMYKKMEINKEYTLKDLNLN